jgi:hypothetical protein
MNKELRLPEEQVSPISESDIKTLRAGLSTGKYPIRWLTYKQRVREDVLSALSKPGGKDFFSPDYCTRLENSASSRESWELKIFATQLAISIFIVLGYMSSDSSLSLFGISFKNSAGLKEILLGVSVTMAIAAQIITASKHAKILVLEAVSSATAQPEFSEFATLAAPTPFHLRRYLTRQYERWMFPTWPTKILRVALGTLATLSIAGLLIFLFAVSFYVYLDVYRHPAFGPTSYMVLAYAASVFLMAILWAILLHFPLPFRDGHTLKRLQDLKETNKAAYDKVMMQLRKENV